jgi:hypothetical protein
MQSVVGYGWVRTNIVENSNDFRWCVDVEQYAHTDDCQWSEDQDEFFYDPDNIARFRSSGVLMSYDANVLRHRGAKFIIKGKRVSCIKRGTNQYKSQYKKDLVFGVELETDSRNGYDKYEMAVMLDDSAAAQMSKYAITKEDSTVSGVELVTLPCDLWSHQNIIPWAQWCELLAPMARGYYGRDNGIHVHINKAAVSPLTLGKMLVFCNASRHRRFLSMVAQRAVSDDAQWARQCPKRIGNGLPRMIDTEKYQMVNISGPTIELRMFNSSLLPDRVLKNVEFCHALVRFCENTSVRHCKPSRFIEYIATDRAIYPNLATFVANRGEA